MQKKHLWGDHYEEVLCYVALSSLSPGMIITKRLRASHLCRCQAALEKLNFLNVDLCCFTGHYFEVLVFGERTHKKL